MFSPKVFLRSLGFLLLLLLTLGTTGCDIEDDRDLCCERLTLHYRYVRQDFHDEFRQHIQHMRHFLFDQHGRFVRELPPSQGARQDVRLNRLPLGTYTVVTVANATQTNTQLNELAASWSTLTGFRLALTHLVGTTPEAGGAIHGNGDELFWNARTFTAQRKREQRIICDLSNVHCHLYVKVKWNTVPKVDGDYTMRLTQVPLDYSLSPTPADTILGRHDEDFRGESTPSQVVRTFPRYAGAFGTHDLTVPLYNLELEGTFTTLRYSDAHIPTLQLFHGNNAVTKPIDLRRAFLSWNWMPSSQPEQDYKIELTLYDDGRVIVNQWAETSVLDWVDGGSFGL